MPVRRFTRDDGTLQIELLDITGDTVPEVAAFLRHLAARDYSPNTLIAYAHDLQHLWRFLATQGLGWRQIAPPHALDLLAYLRTLPSTHAVQRLGLALTTTHEGRAARCLAPTTINRILASISSFYDYLITAGQFTRANPLEKIPAPHARASAGRHRAFLAGIHRQSPRRRRVAVRTVERIPRVLEGDQVQTLLGALRSTRDLAMIRLMLDGGLRPGEVLSLHLEDIAYGRRRVTIRRRCDHPKGARPKSRVERVVDLYEPETLSVLTTYVMGERPSEADTPFVFLVGGRGPRRVQPLSYAALVKLFRRACDRAGLTEPWLTPHSLRHTHATRMWEGGMRELTLQKRLGHASVESTRIYTRVSDAAVVADYRRALGSLSDEVAS
jgi:integrase